MAPRKGTPARTVISCLASGDRISMLFIGGAASFLNRKYLASIMGNGIAAGTGCGGSMSGRAGLMKHRL